jgi:glycosyltransferase involved in cell wall biosynthesis
VAESKRRVLLVAQLAPPSPLVAARRVEGLTKYLAREGFEITVLTSAISGDGDIDGASQVVRAPDLLATRLNWRRRHFEALTGESRKTTYGKPSRLEAVLVPDVAAATWLPFAAGSIPKLLRGRSFDCVVSSSPPPTAHLVGYLLHRRGVPWIAEFRDGWLYERLRDWPLGWQRRFDAALERNVVLGADAIVGITQPIAEDLQQRYGVSAVAITNGFDPEERVSTNANGLLDPNRHSLVYTGRIAYSGLTPAPLVNALRRLQEVDPSAAAQLEVVLAGPLLQEEEQAFAAPDLQGIVRTVGSLDRADALGLQRDADSLLVIANGKRERSVATGKLFEYLGARKPIVVLGDASAAARIVEESEAGLTTSGSDADAIAHTLLRLLKGPLSKISEEGASRYAYPAIAQRYAELIESVCR